MNLRKSGFTQHRANQDIGIQNNRSVAHFLFRCAFLGCLCTFTRRFEIGDYGFNINALSRKQSVQGCAGFLQRGNVRIGLAVGRDEVAYGLTMACHSNRRAGRNEISHASAKFPNTYFGSFHLFTLQPKQFCESQCTQYSVSLACHHALGRAHACGHNARRQACLCACVLLLFSNGHLQQAYSSPKMDLT